MQARLDCALLAIADTVSPLLEGVCNSNTKPSPLNHLKDKVSAVD